MVLMSIVGTGGGIREASEALAEGVYGGMNVPSVGPFSEQYGGGAGIGSGISSLPGSGLLGAPAGWEGTRIVPMISVSEAYDTNVYFAPKTAGLQREDFVSTVAPGLSIQHNTRLYTATVSGSAVGTYYVNHPQLGYVGTNAAVSIGLTPFVARYFPGSTLALSYGYSYTPTPPAFLTGGSQTAQSSASGAPADGSVADTYTRGLQLGRVNTTSHRGGIAGAYQLGPGLTMQANYGYAVMFFGSSPAQVQGTTGFRPVANNIATHSASAGPRYQPTAYDTLSLTYSYSSSSYGDNSGGTGSLGFSSHSATAGWGRKLSSAWTASLSGGASLVQVNSQNNASDTITYNGSAMLSWSRGFTTAGINYSVGVYPNYLNAAGPLLSHNVSVFGTHRLSDQLSGTAGASVAENSTVGNAAQSNRSYQSYTANASLAYKLSLSLFAALSYSYSLFEGPVGASGSAQQETQVSRHATTLTLVKYFQ